MLILLSMTLLPGALEEILNSDHYCSDEENGELIWLKNLE